MTGSPPAPEPPLSDLAFRALVAGVTDHAVVMLDPAGRVAGWNAGAERLLGYREAEVVGAYFGRFFTPEDRRGGLPERELDAARREGRADDENWLLRADGTRFWASGTSTAIRDARGELRGFAKIVRDLTRYKRAEAELADLLARERAARAAAEAAVRQRDEFLGIAAHELRTPLTTLKGFVQLLARQLARPDAGRPGPGEAIGQVQRQLARLERLIGDLLDVARIRQGWLELRRAPTDAAALAREVLARFEHAPERTPAHRLVLEAPAPVTGAWDADRLDQLLTNLLANALKYSPAGGEVRVRVRRVGDRAELAVSYQGLGIAPEEQADLFQPFARAAGAPRRIEGLGLGLYISRQIAERHGGTIAVRSAPGAGSTFTVRLPLAPPP